MNIDQKVLITWGTYKGLTGTITATRYTKNIIVKLDSKPFEIEVSSDHIEPIKEEQQSSVTVLNKIKSIFGDNFTIKSKKVSTLVNESLHSYKLLTPEDSYHLEDIHYFTINKPYKVQGVQFDHTTIKATKLKSGVWRITE